MAKLKVGRDILEINEKDIILDNSACYQIITKEVGRIGCKHSPVMSKKLFNDLKERGAVYTNENLRKMAAMRYKTETCVFYKFDLEKL